MSDAAKPVKKKNAANNWLLWWVITPTELQEQLDKYGQLKIWQSARGISLLLFVSSALLTAALVELVSHQRSAYLDTGVFLILAVFIYFGHRWAMVLGMVLWTLEKVFQLVDMVRNSHFTNPIGILIFWAVFMHAMFLAFRVEQERRKSPTSIPDVFD